MKLKTKLFISFFTLVLLLLIIGSSGTYFIRQNSTMINTVQKKESIVLLYNNIAFQTVRANAAIRGYMLYQDPVMLQNHNQIRLELQKSINKVKKLNGNSSDFKTFTQDLNKWENQIDHSILPLVKSGNTQQAMTVASPILGKGSRNLVAYSKNMANKVNTQVNVLLKNKKAQGNKVYYFMIIISILAIFIALLLSFIFGRSMSRTIQQVVDKINLFAEGDFRTKLNIKSKDEFGVLAKSFNKMVEKLQLTVKQIGDSSEQVAATSEQLTASSSEVSAATDNISQSILEISRGLDHQKDTTRNVKDLADNVLGEMNTILDHIKDVDSSVSHADTISNNGKQLVSDVIDNMEVILKKANSVTSHLLELDAQTNAISKMVLFIKEIAEQTNLLALNASIEAARAGEHGRGFAVVAEEVRKLAEQSNQSAEEIETVVHNITNKMSVIVTEMKDNEHIVSTGKERVDTTGDSFSQVLESIQDVKTQTHHVNNYIKKIFEDMENLANHIEENDDITALSDGNAKEVAAASEEQSASMQEVAEASGELSKMAMALQHSIQGFKY